MDFFLIIPKPFSTPGMAINHVSFSSVDLNNVNTGKISDRENIVTLVGGTNSGLKAAAVKFDIKNERTEKSKKGVNSAISN